jgi:hypothetical protein
MTRKEAIVEELLENIDKMLDVIEEHNKIDPDFTLAHEIAEQLREEIVTLRE